MARILVVVIFVLDVWVLMQAPPGRLPIPAFKGFAGAVQVPEAGSSGPF